MNNKIIVIFVIGIMIIAGLLTLIPLEKNNSIQNNISNNKLTENVFNIGKYTILEINENNKTYYYYDNNFTQIVNINSLMQINNFLSVNEQTTYSYYYTQDMFTIPSINLNKIFPLQSGLPMNISGYFYRLITHAYYNGGYFNYSFMGEINNSATIGFTANAVINDFSIQNIPNIYYYQSNISGKMQFVSNLFTKGFNYQIPYLSNFGNLTLIHNNILFNSIAGYYNFTMSNYISNGNITISNNSGFVNSFSLNLGTNLFLLLQNGSYQYKFSYSENNITYYINKSFNVSGQNVIIILGNVNSQSSLFLYIFIIINAITLIITYLSSKNYLLLIPIQALFLITGYSLNIQYYQFYLISIFILFIALYISFEIMNRIGD